MGIIDGNLERNMSFQPENVSEQAHAFKYKYPKLPPKPNTTRMIRLLPHEDKSAPIECEIFDYDLSEVENGGHVYEALSYVWGSEVRYHTIRVNGCDLAVTSNLHAALLHLRNHRLQRTLWIDAISIDQGDTEEKSKQIPIMRNIYAQAQQVVVWLGEAIGGGDGAIEQIRCLAEGQAASSGMSVLEKDYDACLSLLGRDWFERVCVGQYPNLQKNNTTHSGNRCFRKSVWRDVYRSCAVRFKSTAMYSVRASAGWIFLRNWKPRSTQSLFS